jgi:transposase
MAKPAYFPPGTVETMQSLMKEAKTAEQLRRVQCVLLGAQHVKAEIIAQSIGRSEDAVHRAWKRYRDEGAETFLEEKRGQTRGRAHLSLDEETAFLKPFIDTANSSGMLVATEVHTALEKKLRKTLKPSITYNMLARHGWRKIVPKSRHPKVDEAAQKKFRESFPPENS